MPLPTSDVDRFEKENIRAEEAVAANNLSEAAGILVRIVGNDPENARAYNTMGILSWSRKNWIDAYTMFLKSVSLKPDYTDALMNLFDAALKLRKIPEVASWFENAAAANPTDQEIAVLWDSIREQGNGIYQSRRALAIGFFNPLIEEAKQELDSGNLYKAMELFLKVNDENGPDPAAYCGLGIISYYQERYNDAVVLFIESIKLNPTDPDTFLNLLDAANACNRKDDAITVFQTYRKEFEELQALDNYFQK